MKYRTFNKPGIKVSELGYGCQPIGGGWGDEDDQRDIESLRLAYENGVTFFDTAMAYGRSEEVLGKALKDIREKVVIATKILPKEDASKPADIAYPYDWVIKCTEDSLKPGLDDKILERLKKEAWEHGWLYQWDSRLK